MAGSDRQDGGAAARASAPASSPLLERLRRGEIGLDEYLDDRTEHAMRHLRSTLSAEQLASVRATLREQLLTDPVLVELVRRATGEDVSTRDAG
jgi:hypothetical protein